MTFELLSALFFRQIETIDNPLPAIELILQRCTKEQVNSMIQFNFELKSSRFY